MSNDEEWQVARESVGEIGLIEAVASLRAELAEAVERGQDEDIQFPVGKVDIEFQIGVTRDFSGGGKLRFWVVELSASGGYEAETIHKIKLRLDAPIDAYGDPIKIRRRLRSNPE
jgi:hypothetical protein